MEGKVISVVFTHDDVAALADEHDIDYATALERAYAWSSSIEDTARNLIHDQLTGAIAQDQP